MKQAVVHDNTRYSRQALPQLQWKRNAILGMIVPVVLTIIYIMLLSLYVVFDIHYYNSENQLGTPVPESKLAASLHVPLHVMRFKGLIYHGTVPSE